MSIVGVFVLALLVVLMVWLIAHIGLQEPFRSIIMVILLILVLIGVLHVLGLMPYGSITLR